MNKLMMLLLAFLLSLSLFACNIDRPLDEEFEYADDLKYLTGHNLAKNIQDGVILHAWNWSYNSIKENLEDIADAGFSTVQTSPVQQCKGYSKGANEVASCWWKLYQPVSYTVGNTWLGDANDLKDLCEEAKKYDIKIICDIVFNHLGNNAGDGNDIGLSQEVKEYEPEIYNNQNTYLHSKTNLYITQSWMDGELPDVNTSNSYIQERSLALLKECIDLGVSGFRFDAAKHIETPTDESYPSSFWDVVLNGATNYAKEKYDRDIYYYGEILGDPEGGRNIEAYTKYMSVTDNGYSGNIFTVAGNKILTNADYYVKAKYSKGNDPTKIVLWAESHDTYQSSQPKEVKINRCWSVVANRLGATALYFARPGEASMGEVGSYEWASQEVTAINKFHNAFIGANEEMSLQDGYIVNERFRTDSKTGVIITNCSSTNKNGEKFTVKVKHLKDGTYYDQVTGNKFTCKNEKVTGIMGESGIAVLYNMMYEKVLARPIMTISVPSEFHYTGQKTVANVIVKNATSVTFNIDGGKERNLASDGGQIIIDQNCTLTVTAKGEKEITKTYTFKNVKEIEKRTGYWAIAGISDDTLANYTIYAWVWPENGGGVWRAVTISNGVAYIKKESNDYGMLLATFIKGTPIAAANWQTNKEQTKDYGKPLDDNVCYTSNL